MKTKKVLAALTAAAMVLSIGFSAFAAEETADITVATVGDVSYTSLQEAFNALAANGGTLTLLKDVSADDYTKPVSLTKSAVIDGNKKTISGLKMPLVKNVSGTETVAEFKNMTIDGANITQADEYNNGLGVAAYVCWINTSGEVVFTDCNLLNSTITSAKRVAGYISYCDGNAVTINGGKIENCTLTAGDGVGGAVAWIDKPLTINGVTIKGNTIKSTEDRKGSTIIAGTVVGTATGAAGVVEISAIVEGNTTTQNISNADSKVTTVYGRVINNAPLTITGGTYDAMPIVESETVKVKEGFTLKDNGNGTFGVEITDSADAVTITDVSRTVSYDAELFINQYFDVEGLNKEYVLANGGLLVWNTPVTDALASFDSAYKSKLTYFETRQNGKFGGRTEGIAAKEYADTFYFCSYVMLENGSYVFGKINETAYSVDVYCNNRLNNDDTTQEEKDVCAALQAYGKAAKKYFKY